MLFSMYSGDHRGEMTEVYVWLDEPKLKTEDKCLRLNNYLHC